jgi:hypothetical protein
LRNHLFVPRARLDGIPIHRLRRRSSFNPDVLRNLNAARSSALSVTKCDPTDKPQPLPAGPE